MIQHPLSYLRRRNRRPATPALVEILLGLLFFLVGALFAQDALNFARVAQSATGTVVHVERKVSRDRDGNRDTTYQPTLRYKAASGRTHRAVTHLWSSAYNYADGARVEILYAPNGRNRSG